MAAREQSATPPSVDILNRPTSSLINDIRMRSSVDVPHIKRPRISPQERQRAPVACISCRLSKIRCSASSSGMPCAHCRLKGVPCIIRPVQKDENVEQRSPAKVGTRQGNSEAAINAPVISIPSDDESSEQSGTDEVDTSWLHEELWIDKTFADWSIPTFYSSLSKGLLDIPHVLSRDNLLPPYIKPLPAHILQEDLEYLAKKGALSVPDLELRDELLRCYIEFVPGNLPGPDWHDILAHVEQRNSSDEGLSLLLFQAVMFVGTAFIDLEHLKRIGFETRRVAREAFFKKVRLLYDFDYENDRICLIQSLLLMTYWYETPDDQKDCWHWMGLALAVASTIGLNRDTQRPDINERERRMRRRLWWSCIMRDPIIALGMKRPTRIRELDHNIPMLTLDDFDISAVSGDTSPVSDKCAIARDSTKQYQQTIMCIEQAKLCQIMGNILSVQYDIFDSFPKGRAMDRNTQTTAVLLPITCEPNTVEFNRCDEDLQNWLERLPEEAMYTPVQPSGLDEADHGLVLLRAMDHLIYFTALSALHRPRSLFSSAFQRTAPHQPLPSRIQASRATIHEAAAGITSIARDLHRHGLTHYLPLTGLSAILPAMLSHLVDFQSPDKIVRDRAREAYSDCMLVVHEIGKTHPAADFTFKFLTAAAHRVMGLATEDITQRDRQAVAETSGKMKTVNLEPTLHTTDAQPVGDCHPSGMSYQSNPDGEMDYSGGYSPRSPPSIENREHSQTDPYDINPSDIFNFGEAGINPFDDIFNFGEVGAIFWPYDWVSSSHQL